MDFHLDRGSPIHLSEQLKAQIKLRIRRRLLLPGARLPTIKDLARRLGVNANTVAGAYRELEADGLLETNRRAGTRVARAPTEGLPAELLAARIGSELGERVAAAGLSLDAAMTALAAAACMPGDEPLKVAVLGRTPLDAETAARRAAAALGNDWRYVPVTPEAYLSADYHATLIDPDLVPVLNARPNVVRDVGDLPYGHDFPAAAD